MDQFVAANHSAIHVLLVDDNISYAKTVQSQLKQFEGKEFKITWEKFGVGGIEKLKKDSSIDIVILNYDLKKTTGLDIAREIRAQKIDVPIVFVTTSKDFSVAVEAMKLAVDDFLVKDEIVGSILPRTVLNVLNRAQLYRQIAQVGKNKIIAQKKTEAIKEVVVTICHEFNNPLAAIKISTEIISRQKLNPLERTAVAELDKNIRTIEKEIIKLRDINLSS
ncbi:MAG: response regulator [Bacteroidota bacterium]|nr:response regulator [Bacteroidota bacterium]